MSEFAKMLRRRVNSVPYDGKLLEYVKSRGMEFDNNDASRVLHLEALVSARAYISATELLRLDDPEEVVALREKELRRQMVELMFGEFRPLITNLHLAILERDASKAMNALTELERRMFEEGV